MYRSDIPAQVFDLLDRLNLTMKHLSALADLLSIAATPNLEDATLPDLGSFVKATLSEAITDIHSIISILREQRSSEPPQNTAHHREAP